MNCPKDQCFINLPQHFLVCLTIHKAKDLQTLNADTYVTVTLDKKTKQTNTFKNSDCPYFNEYFVFEYYCSLTELLRLNVSLVVFNKTGCTKKDVRLGEIVVDLNMIWSLESNWLTLEISTQIFKNIFRSFISQEMGCFREPQSSTKYQCWTIVSSIWYSHYIQRWKSYAGCFSNSRLRQRRVVCIHYGLKFTSKINNAPKNKESNLNATNFLASYRGVDFDGFDRRIYEIKFQQFTTTVNNDRCVSQSEIYRKYSSRRWF